MAMLQNRVVMKSTFRGHCFNIDVFLLAQVFIFNNNNYICFEVLATVNLQNIAKRKCRFVSMLFVNYTAI